MNKYIFEKVTAMVVIGLYSFVGIDTAFADAGTNSTPTVTENSNVTLQDTTSIQQNGIQFNGFSNPLTPPSCNKPLCSFIMFRNTPYGSESSAGIVFQLGKSPENTQAESQKLLAIAQKEKLDQESTVILADKLSEAIENNKTERANLYAIILAKKLGLADYRQLLKDINIPIKSIR